MGLLSSRPRTFLPLTAPLLLPQDARSMLHFPVTVPGLPSLLQSPQPMSPAPAPPPASGPRKLSGGRATAFCFSCCHVTKSETPKTGPVTSFCHPGIRVVQGYPSKTFALTCTPLASRRAEKGGPAPPGELTAHWPRPPLSWALPTVKPLHPLRLSFEDTLLLDRTLTGR